MKMKMSTMNQTAPMTKKARLIARRGKVVGHLVAVAAVTVFAVSGWAQMTGAPTEPTGFAKVSIEAGTGTAKKTTLVSIPLLEDPGMRGKSSGRITGLGANTITVAGAGWTAGALSGAAAPFLLEITSGQAQGRMLMISTAVANTADTVTIDSGEMARLGSLGNLGIVADATNGDTFRIRPMDTLGSFFGTPDTTGILGGTSPATADTVTLVVNGSATTYFYHTGTNPPRWSRVGLGTTDASNVPIPPYAGVQYARLANTGLEFHVMGRIPSGVRQVAVKNSGTTLLSSYWPVGQTLGELGLQNLPNWASGPTAAEADTVVLTAGGSVTTYFHDGTDWRRVGLGGGSNANATPVPVGASVLINKKGNAGGFATYQHTAPYHFSE
jgi:hypothetical protein